MVPLALVPLGPLPSPSFLGLIGLLFPASIPIIQQSVEALPAAILDALPMSASLCSPREF